MDNLQHVTDLIPAFALDCLDDEDLVQVAEHLAICQSCQQELAVYQELADQLPLALPMSAPPAALKTRLMSAVSQASSVRPAERERAPRRWLVWALAGGFAILLLVVSNLLMWNQVRQLAKIETPVVALQGVGPGSGAAGTLVASLDGARGTLVVDRLTQLDPSLQYQLWLIKDGQRTSGGVFSVGKSGYGYLYVRSPAPLLSYDSYGITIEPVGGSPSPTGEKVMGSET